MTASVLTISCIDIPILSKDSLFFTEYLCIFVVSWKLNKTIWKIWSQMKVTITHCARCKFQCAEYGRQALFFCVKWVFASVNGSPIYFQKVKTAIYLLTTG